MDIFISLTKAFIQLENFFDQIFLDKFSAFEYSELDQYHFGFGTWIRNHLLVSESELYKVFVQGGVSGKDEMSSLILKLFYLHLNTK